MSFAELLAFNRMRLKLSKKELAEKLGISATMISKYESGQNFPRPEVLGNLANLFEINLNEFYESKIADQHNDFVTFISEREDARISLSKEVLKGIGSHILELELFVYRGNGMSPTVNDGDLILIDHKQKDIMDGSIYLFESQGVETLYRTFLGFDGQVTLARDNPKFPTQVASQNELNISGRVVWRGGNM